MATGILCAEWLFVCNQSVISSAYDGKGRMTAQHSQQADMILQHPNTTMEITRSACAAITI
jgi:hypothetical protein